MADTSKPTVGSIFGYSLLVAIAAVIAIVKNDGPNDGDIRIAAAIALGLAIVGIAIGLWPAWKATATPPGGGGDRMFATLSALGIPVDLGLSDPRAALAGGFLKATVYRGVSLLDAGNLAEAIQALTVVVDSKVIDEDPKLLPMRAVALFARGIAREKIAAPSEARADYARALEIAPPDWPSRSRCDEALRRLSPG